MQFVIGAVTSVKGTSVRALINPNLYQTTYIYDGKLYRGVSINEYIVIKKGYHEIVGKIEGEEVIERKSYNQEQPNSDKYDRFIDLKIIGYVQDNSFQPGIKYLPMIQDSLYLASDTLISAIYTFSGKVDSKSITIGKSLLEDIPIRIPINGVFNSHLGIFGNTGSGKSNTLAKLYIELFSSFRDKIFANSRFMFIDFNGEYRTMHNTFNDYSSYVDLDTHAIAGKDKLFLKQSEFWDAELLSVLFSATEKTQKPFLNILIRNRIEYGEELNNYFQKTLQVMFGQNQHRETISVLRSIIKIINPDNEENISAELAAFSWFSRGESNKYYLGSIFPNTPEEYLAHTPCLRSTYINQELLTAFEQLSVRATLQLIQSVSRNYVQYEHISPLIGKINASTKSLEKVIKIISDVEIRPTPLTFISALLNKSNFC